ncbi:MAG TPA: hypothetical protein VJ875_13790 [Pyrinomonadaceae bacterium]|nr:hypothetical protein [Pyrinomonadaceae bacterium]
MNEDYLWDKSGEPDPEIQQLEEILRPLRYRPKPLALPANLAVHQRRRYFPMLAIAATVLLALVAAGLWFRLHAGNKSQSQQANVTNPQPALEQKKTSRDAIVKNAIPAPAANPIAGNNKHRNRAAFAILKQREREEALAAKEQLMFALRLASEKLNLAQRKTQGATPANQIKNQHRVG